MTDATNAEAAAAEAGEATDASLERVRRHIAEARKSMEEARSHAAYRPTGLRRLFGRREELRYREVMSALNCMAVEARAAAAAEAAGDDPQCEELLSQGRELAGEASALLSSFPR